MAAVPPGGRVLPSARPVFLLAAKRRQMSYKTTIVSARKSSLRNCYGPKLGKKLETRFDSARRHARRRCKPSTTPSLMLMD